jgi:hypothetical protein
MKIRDAGNSVRALFRFGQDRQKHRRQNADDRNDHEQFNQSESRA